ncbi:biotin-dependent carboxyltransferase family protein [Vibrio intestinalis]|uniref:5-oxoprolinase subunit C family protein n=1 Tax=Vibrio intestinalis TaxID=2933291 RepID=UPI0021A8B24A|nr:biotin-dependent carboxyltransferase family protein [Vibrio intestinalis]
MSRDYIEIIKPGALSLLQDLGRFGQSQMGITQGGALDDYAYSWANKLLSNPAGAACIEITLGQSSYRINADCQLAITGAEMNAKLDDQPIANWASFNARKGQTLSFAIAQSGLRSYLAVKHGFQVEPQLGSTSTVARDKLGGLTQGLALQPGDKLPVIATQASKQNQLSFRFTPDYSLPIKLRVIEGFQTQLFSDEALNHFYQTSFTVSQNINRMGYRLTGAKVDAPTDTLLSEGIALGAIQVPPDGEPIILLNDRQTLGGYPKLGCVARVDLPRLAQAKPGQTVSFVKGDLSELQSIWCRWADYFGY